MRVDEIVITCLPEQRRLRAAIQLFDPIRRPEVTSPMTGDVLADLDAAYQVIRQAVEAHVPRAKVRETEVPTSQDHPDVGRYTGSFDGETLSVERVRPEAADALRAEAEAAGVRVDRRWGEARLREEIAAVSQQEPAQADSNEGR